jgi:tetratricopeptide (TPR) repeat protein
MIIRFTFNGFGEKGMRVLLSALLLCLCLGQQPSVYADDQVWIEGLQHFQAKRYNAAAECFERAISANPGVQKYHYYLGASLRNSRNYGAAHDAFENAFRLNPFSELGNMAKQTLMELEDQVAKQQHPIDDPALYGQALGQIDRQAGENQANWTGWGNREANFQRQLGQIEVRKIEDETRQRYSDYRKGIAHGYSLTINEAQLKMGFIAMDSQTQAAKYSTTGFSAAVETQSSANMLKQLLSEPYRPGVPHLRALGTNLYVRNYAPFDYNDAPYIDPPQELRATSLRLMDLPRELHAVPMGLANLPKKQTTGEQRWTGK